jgi:hypothetical protein
MGIDIVRRTDSGDLAGEVKSIAVPYSAATPAPPCCTNISRRLARRDPQLEGPSLTAKVQQSRWGINQKTLMSNYVAAEHNLNGPGVSATTGSERTTDRGSSTSMPCSSTGM